MHGLGTGRAYGERNGWSGVPSYTSTEDIDNVISGDLKVCGTLLFQLAKLPRHGWWLIGWVTAVPRHRQHPHLHIRRHSGCGHLDEHARQSACECVALSGIDDPWEPDKREVHTMLVLELLLGRKGLILAYML